MPITVNVLHEDAKSLIKACFRYFGQVDRKFSTYKASSEISKINEGLPKKLWSSQMKEVLRLCDETKKLTHGYFNIEHNGKIDPSGLVKGWAIYNAADLLLKNGARNFFVDAGGDVQFHGRDGDKPWTVGIRNPFNEEKVIKSLVIPDGGIATSGMYFRGQHIYNPHDLENELHEVSSLTVVAKNVFEADRFVTAAFAMGRRGIDFIKDTTGLEGYMVDSDGRATYTDGFERFVVNDA